MDKKQLSDKLNKAFGEDSVKLIAPMKFLSFVEEVLVEQYQKIVQLVSKERTLEAEALRKELQESKALLEEIKRTISESKVEAVDVKNFPEAKEFPVFPSEVAITMPDWYQKSLDDLYTKLEASLKANFDQAEFNKPLQSVPFYANRDTVVVEGVGGKRVKVFAVKCNLTGDGAVNWMDNELDLEGRQDYIEKGGYTESIAPPLFLFQTSVGSPLRLHVDMKGNGVAAGRVSYWIE